MGKRWANGGRFDRCGGLRSGCGCLGRSSRGDLLGRSRWRLHLCLAGNLRSGLRRENRFGLSLGRLESLRRSVATGHFGRSGQHLWGGGVGNWFGLRADERRPEAPGQGGNDQETAGCKNGSFHFKSKLAPDGTGASRNGSCIRIPALTGTRTRGECCCIREQPCRRRSCVRRSWPRSQCRRFREQGCS